jgi:hypothetical protein
MFAQLLAAALLLITVNEQAARQKQAKLAREAAIAMRVHAVHDSERESVLSARIAQLFRNEPPALCVWTDCAPWLKVVAVLGAVSLTALVCLGILAARPIHPAARA